MAWVCSIFPRPSILSCEENIRALSTEMNELRNKREDIQQQIDVAEMEGRLRTHQVELWLERVVTLEKDAMAIVDVYQRRSCRCPGCFFFSLDGLSVKAARKNAEAVELKGRGNFGQVAYDLIPVRFVAVPNTPTVGMESELEQLSKHVGDDEVPIISILGMGGVGKSALLKRFHNEFLVGETDVDLVMFMELSNPFDEEDAQRAIGARLGLQWVATRTVEERAIILFNFLLERKFVLILDNLWMPLDLEIVGVPIPAAGSKSKIIVASRFEQVSFRMVWWWSSRMIRVECLRWDEAWKLFLDKAGSGAELIHSDPGINKYAKEIAHKCGGLPLALITISRALASNKTIEEWEYDAAILDREPWKIQGMVCNVLNSLKLSYDHLSVSESLLSSWVLNAAMVPEVMPRLGLSEEDIRHFFYTDLFYIIQRESLILPRVVQMHPMVRMLISWLGCIGRTGSKWLVRQDTGLTTAPDAEEWRLVERISLANNMISRLPVEPDCPALTTLLLLGNMILKEIPDEFFRYMPCLRVLDLSRTGIQVLPSSIAHLIELRYLNLSHTRLVSLPRELGSLVKLMFLDLHHTSQLRTIPAGVIASLTKLEMLDMFVSYVGWEVGSSIADGRVGIEELESLKQLSFTGMSIQTVGALNMLLGSRTFYACFRIDVQGCPGLTTLQLPSRAPLENMKFLRDVRLSDCKDLSEVEVGCGTNACTGDDCAFNHRLEFLCLEKLPKTKMIWRGGYLHQLVELHIRSCSGMEQLVDCKDEASRFGRIEIFPNLKEMYLEYLQNLKSFSAEGRAMYFPSLEFLHVDKCPKLKKLRLDVGERKVVVRCSGEWWDVLEWDEAGAIMPLVEKDSGCVHVDTKKRCCDLDLQYNHEPGKKQLPLMIHGLRGKNEVSNAISKDYEAGVDTKKSRSDLDLQYNDDERRKKQLPLEIHGPIGKNEVSETEELKDSIAALHAKIEADIAQLKAQPEAKNASLAQLKVNRSPSFQNFNLKK